MPGVCKRRATQSDGMSPRSEWSTCFCPGPYDPGGPRALYSVNGSLASPIRPVLSAKSSRCTPTSSSSVRWRFAIGVRLLYLT